MWSYRHDVVKKKWPGLGSVWLFQYLRICDAFVIFWMENTLDLLQDQMFEIKKHTALRSLNDCFFKRLGRETYRANILYETKCIQISQCKIDSSIYAVNFIAVFLFKYNFFVIYSRNLMFTKWILSYWHFANSIFVITNQSFLLIS